MALTRQTLHADTAVAYLRDALSQGRSLSHRLLDLNLERGRIWTYLRPDVSLDYAQAHLNETWLVVADNETEPATVIGGYRIRRKPMSLDSLFVSFIRQFMERTSRACCVFEDPLRSTSDPFWKTRRPEPYACHGEDIFYILEHGTATPKTIAEGLKETSSGGWIQNVFLTLLPLDVKEIRPWANISNEQMSALASNVEAILVSAFDGVGYVVWENN
jgi:hypothetical protein